MLVGCARVLVGCARVLVGVQGGCLLVRKVLRGVANPEGVFVECLRVLSWFEGSFMSSGTSRASCTPPGLRINTFPGG